MRATDVQISMMRGDDHVWFNFSVEKVDVWGQVTVEPAWHTPRIFTAGASLYHFHGLDSDGVGVAVRIAQAMEDVIDWAERMLGEFSLDEFILKAEETWDL